MDLTLTLIKTRVNLWTIKKRIENARLEIEKKRPEALEYIQGARQSEEELLEAYNTFQDLEAHALTLSRENIELARRNIYLQQRLKDLEFELKTSNF